MSRDQVDNITDQLNYQQVSPTSYHIRKFVNRTQYQVIVICAYENVSNFKYRRITIFLLKLRSELQKLGEKF